MEIQDENVTKEDLEKTRQLIDLRVYKLGVAETGNLTFQDDDGNVLLTGSDVEQASTMLDNQTSSPVVFLNLNAEGETKFALRPLQIILEKKFISIWMTKKFLIQLLKVQ